MKNYLVKAIFIVLCLISTASIAAWTTKSTVLSGTWGDGNQQFHVEWGDSPAYTSFPALSDIADDGTIAVSNDSQIKLYSSSGQWIRNISPPYSKDYGVSPYFIGDNIVLAADKLYFITRTGDLIATAKNYASNYLGQRYGMLYLAKRKETQWLSFSENGKLLQTYSQKPAQLGLVKQSLFYYGGRKLYRVTVTFPNKTWININGTGACGEYDYFVDGNGHLYCVDDSSAVRYSACGKPIATFNLPKNVFNEQDSSNPGDEPAYTVVNLFEDLKLDKDGNLYSSDITQDGYSVVKWAWQTSPNDPVGGPDAPIQLEGVSDNTGSVMLKWVYSLQDPGCVTGYEVGRATTAGGPYTTVGTVSPGDIKNGYTYHDTTGKSGNTYYYAVRAVSAIGDSPYSNEVSVTVK